MNFAMYFFRFIVLLLLIGSLRANFVESISDPLIPDICGLVNCVKGTCKPSNTLPWFECECDRGWTQPKVGDHVIFPTCIVPNCTLNFDCGAGSPSSSPPPPPPPPPPPINLSNPCTITWCGFDGTCMANGTGVICKCDANSANLGNKTEFPCFKECFFEADCHDLGFGIGSPAPPSPTSNASPPPNLTGSNHNGSIGVGIQFALTLLSLSALFLSWL